MKIKTFSALILSAAFTLPASAATTTVSGADYIQSDLIVSKKFQMTNSNDGKCDIQERTFSGNIENRLYTNSNDNEQCDEIFEQTLNKIITPTSLSYSSYIVNGYTYFEDGALEYSIEGQYEQVLTIIKDELTIGESWGGDLSNESYTYTYKGYAPTEGNIDRTDSFTLNDIVDINVASIDFYSCLEIDWETNKDEFKSEITMWICPGVGLVKYTHQQEETYESWELQSLQEEKTISGADYIQSNAITYKLFKDVNSSSGECDIEERTFVGSNESRVFSNSNNQESCAEYSYEKEINSSSLYYLGHSYYKEHEEYYSTSQSSYSPKLPMIVDQIIIGKSYGGESSYILSQTYEKIPKADTDVEYYKGTTKWNYSSTITPTNIQPITVTTGTYDNCLKLTWAQELTLTETDGEPINDGISFGSIFNLWMCPSIGLVKYEDTKSNQSFELQDLKRSTPVIGENTDGSSGGSGGGGSLPISIITILGFVAISRRH